MITSETNMVDLMDGREEGGGRDKEKGKGFYNMLNGKNVPCSLYVFWT